MLMQQQWNCTRLLVVTLQVAAICSLLTVRAAPMAGGDDLMLSLSLGASSQQQQAQQAINSQLMEQIMSDHYKDDFQLSLTLINQLKLWLEEFGKQAKVELQGAPISSWYTLRGGRAHQAYMALELDRVFQTFWSEFGPLVESILDQRPPNLTQDSLDFRCKKVDELKRLKALASGSAIYGLFAETFFSELYQHCLLRKLAMIKINSAIPSSLVRQFVDIYIDLPTKNLAAQENKETRDQVAAKLLAGQALNLKLDEAIARHGSLETVADLTFDPRAALSMNPTGATQVVQDFRQQCSEHAQRISTIWADFDAVAGFLSSETSNLSEFNEKIKLAAPQLVYATICGRLVAAA